MLLLEYQAKKLLAGAGLSVPRGRLVDNSFQFGEPIILKVQVPTGNRGKHGGVVKVSDLRELHAQLDRLKRIKVNGHSPEAILAEEILEFDREHYFSLLVDRATEEIRMLARVRGGIEVEDMPGIVLSLPITAENLDQSADDLRKFYGYNDTTRKDFSHFLHAAFACLVANDALLLEINPLVHVRQTLFALDCKMEIDDNALFRHPSLTPHKPDANFVMLRADGNTAVVANGAGLAMATVDQISQAGLSATNFLDIGGGANTETITEQFARLAELPNLKVIIVNIFAGITRCDQVAEAIVKARQNVDNLPPLCIRLYGTNYKEAKSILSKADIGLFASLHECIEAAKHV